MRPIRAGGRATGAGGCFAVSHKGIAAAKAMTNHSFHEKAASLTLGEIAELTGAQLAQPERAALRIEGLAVIGEAGPSHLTFLENAKYAADLDECHAGACFVAPRLEARLPPRIAALRTAHPQRAFVAITRRFYPSTLRPEPVIADSGVSPQAAVHPTARLEDGVVVEPFAVIGANVEIGAGTVIGAGAAIGREVSIGRNCSIGAQVTLAYAIIGNNVIVQPGCRIGQDGFGYLPGPAGHAKVPQAGRVIIQNDVEIGANTTVDRGALRDTVIGEGTKIDNLVQIAHNVVIGRHCIIVAQVGIAGSATIGDGVIVGPRVGISSHLTVGDGSQIAGAAIVLKDLSPGGRWGGIPAKPARLWIREMHALERLARGRTPPGGASAAPSDEDET